MKGSIQKRIGPQGVAYRVRVEYPPDPVTSKRRQRSETFERKKDAETALAKWVAEIDRGTAVDTTKMTVAEFLRHWLDASAKHRVRATTFEDYQATIDKHIIPEIGSIPVQRLTAAQVQAFYSKKLTAGSGSRTVQLCHLRLSQALAQGVKWGTVARNVCDGVEAPRSTAKKGKTWTPDEARRFLKAAEKDGYSPLWLLALTTGARQGELLGLRWQDLDLVAGTMRIQQTVAVHQAKPIIQAPKSEAANRTIGLPSEAVAELKAHRDRQAFERKAAGDLWEELDLVFATSAGGVVHPSNVLRNFYKLMERAKVTRIRFHDLRHTHATWLLGNGEPVATVSERLGHARSSITWDTYAHVIASTRDRSAETVSALLFGQEEAGLKLGS